MEAAEEFDGELLDEKEEDANNNFFCRLRSFLDNPGVVVVVVVLVEVLYPNGRSSANGTYSSSSASCSLSWNDEAGP